MLPYRQDENDLISKLIVIKSMNDKTKVLLPNHLKVIKIGY